MKLLIVLSLVALAAAIPPPPLKNPNEDVSLLRYENDNNGFGGYKYAFEQSDGTKQEQEGYLKNEGTDNEYFAMKGSYSWVGPDGVTYIVNYVADEDGYQPEIEQGPGGGVPPAVLASLLG